MNKIILILTITLLAFSCSTDIDISKYGYKFDHHIKNKGIKPHFTDIVFYNVSLEKNGKITHDTRTVGTPASMVMRDFNIVTEPSPIEVALSGMAVGDSMTIFSKFSQDTSKISYHLTMIDIQKGK